ncbi:cyclic nucleotide-binding domain-containing protein [Skermanella rosea]|uniref:Cyclic nucleotide-binding domain-containing protein n=1 Tax=Skermanella cutis TaxID=2775420 RepID=A0ABX7B8C8_9PROT|nr:MULTISPECIES: cyclic nucleotide-binding domain-containing protein [Skermanella]QQP89568.1 cyclic nucleotide-binding domain-containing protein [Skermanella sp. TT6]UEM03714.1 cyclic nucleotide-binding domain-containing protein [Skermanella rosea]
MAATFQHKQYSPGEVIFRKGETGTFLYLVERGSVIIWVGDEADKKIIGEVETGGLFGEMAILDRQPRMANASAAGETQLLEMPASVLRQAINRADPLVVQLINVLINNLRRSAKDSEPQV